MLKKAVILAGGKGTRLKEVSETIPKPMMPVVGKPLVEYQIDLCKKYGIQEVVFIVNHLKQSIIDYFGNGDKWDINISYYHEEKPLGTVGGIKEIEPELTEDFLVLYGDVLMDMDLQRLFSFHQIKNADATLVVHPNDHPYDSDLLEANDSDKVVAFHSKPLPEGKQFHNLVNAAAYIFKPTVLAYLEKGIKADFGKDIFPKLITKLNVYAYNTSEYLKDMGTPDRLKKVEKDILSGKVANRSLSKKQKAIFLDRDGVLNYDTDLIHKTEDFTLYDFTANCIKRINQSEYLAIVITNQSVIARGLTDLKGLDEIHKKMEWELGQKHAYLDAIYYCPHHPHSGYPGEVKAFKIECDCRKPKPGMLLEAAKRFNIDLSQSFMIGDSERDVQAGKAAGVRTIGVKTGHGLKNTTTFPDHFVNDLSEAITYIFDKPYQSDVNKIVENIALDDLRPYVVSIGGNSRSGKSSLTSELKCVLKEKGISFLHIELDDWILPKELRKTEIGVLENFQSTKIEDDIKSIFKGETICTNGYARHPKREAVTKKYTLSNAQVVIIEGIIALSTEKLRSIADLKVFRKVDEDVQLKRLESFYHWKEYSTKAFEKLYAHRKQVEYDIIAKDVKFADLVL